MKPLHLPELFEKERIFFVIYRNCNIFVLIIEMISYQDQLQKYEK